MMAGVAFEAKIDCEPGAEDIFKWPGGIGKFIDGSNEEGVELKGV